MERQLKLQHTWTLGEQIGGGGFGRVFAVTDAEGESAVAKLVPKSPGADRELLFVNLKGVRNTIPIVDSGETPSHWVIVMPRAEYSLRDALKNGALDKGQAINVLLDVASALADLDGKIVHRDLKPENILKFEGHWCLADFGISRYAEATTAPDTQKFALSPPYAAPERWRNERATIATDVYSLGVIGFEILNGGGRPFCGPTIEDYRDQHLHADAPDLGVGSTAFKALISECLYKAPGARPNPSNILARLERISSERSSGGLERLREAHLAEVARRSESERQASTAKTERERREELFKSASKSGAIIQTSLLDAIMDAAPTTQRVPPAHAIHLRLGNADLEISAIERTNLKPWNWDAPAFDVIAHASILIRIPRDRYDYEGRGHSLWFCDARQEGRYQWFETSFMRSPFSRMRTYVRPLPFDPGEEAAKALWNGMSEFQLAWPLQPIDIGDLDEFIDRWATWFADASQGKLTSPTTMPERATPRDWRQK